jgi:4-amino-4-deoxy-L-arabinose transferase-like glycosyltransferase
MCRCSGNTKPPLGAWLIAISFKLFGVNEFALRFWSALFATGTVVIVYLFGKEIENKCVGIFSALLLLTNKGFIGFHSARTGDYDVIVTFFITLSLYYFYLSQKRGNNIFFIGVAISTALAVLVKGMVGLFPLAIIGIYITFFKKIKVTILSIESKYAIFSFFLLVLPWFIIRFIRGSDFFIQMFEYDFVARFNEPLEGHVGDWSYYFVQMQMVYGNIGFIILLICLSYSFYLISKRNKSAFFLVVWILVFISVFTIAKSKLFWYIVPIYPAISLLIGYNLVILQKILKIKKVLFMVIFLLFMIVPFLSIIEYTQSDPNNLIIHSIKELKEELIDVNILYIHADENQQSIFLYLNSYVKDKVIVYYDIQNINASKGDGIVILNPERFKILAQNPEYKLIKVTKYATLFTKI